MLQNMKIKNRLNFAFGIMILFTLITAFIGLQGLKQANEHLHEFIERQYEADTAVKMCRIEANVAARTVRDMALNPDVSQYDAYEAKFDNNVKSIKENIKILQSAYTKNDGLVDKYNNALLSWIGIGEKVISAARSGNDKEAQRLIIEECSPALEALVTIVKELDASTDEMKNTMLEESIQTTNIGSYIILIALAASVIFSAIIAKTIADGIKKPIKELDEAADCLANGDLQCAIQYKANDELGYLAHSMRKTMRILSDIIADIAYLMKEMSYGNLNVKTQHESRYVGEFRPVLDAIRSMNSNVSDIIAQINQSSQEVASGSGQVAGSSQAFSQRAIQQTNSIEELAASITHISSQIENNAKNAENADGKANKVGHEMMECNQKMQQMMEAMKEISSSSDEISKIIKTIEDIAFQTNILALNASVEAARAGTAGKGFAVVADEVRNLASKSAEASKGTAALIERSIKAVENGSKIADETAAFLLTAVDGAKDVTISVNLISDASKAQAAAVSEVTEVIEQISTVVQANSSSAEETAAASEELSEQAQVLKGLVSHFQLKDTREA